MIMIKFNPCVKSETARLRNSAGRLNASYRGSSTGSLRGMQTAIKYKIVEREIAQLINNYSQLVKRDAGKVDMMFSIVKLHDWLNSIIYTQLRGTNDNSNA